MTSGKTIPINLIRRFWSFVKINLRTGCWEWQGSNSKEDGTGYGTIKVGDKTIKSHRLAFYLFVGPAKWVLHRCDNPVCCNPSHLFSGTPKDNSQDALAKGRLSNSTFLKKGEENRGAKLTGPQVLWLRREHAKGRSVKQIANYLRVAQSTIYDVLNGRTWTHINDEMKKEKS